MLQTTFPMIAKTLQGLENILAEELIALGANDVQIGRRMVSFSGDKRMLYMANFCLHTALRILKPIKTFTAHNADEVYEQVKSVQWDQYLTADKTFAVDSVVFSEEFRHSMFVSYRVKDAIADFFRDKDGNRPSVRLKNPDVLINIHINENDCTLSLDSSGESLHLRGYRTNTVDAPLNPVLAAGLIKMTGWKGECDLIDPMCGSGTIPIEAALIAQNMAPGIFRTVGYAFERWNDFDADLLEEIYNDDSQECPFEHRIIAMDNSPKAIAIARDNIKQAGMTQCIDLELQAMQQFEQPEEKAIIITNPPYGERISTDGGDILDLYRAIGERLKHAFAGNEAWILSYRDECFDQIGLKATKKIDVLNGELECQFRQYEIFNGKYQSFRENGDELKKERAEEPRRRSRFSDERNSRMNRDERRQAQIRRFMKQNDEDGQERGEHKPWKKDGERKGGFDRGERKPWKKDGERKGGFDRGERKPWKKDGERKGGFDRGERKPWKKDGERKGGFDRGERKGGFGKRDGGFKRGERSQESYPERKKREMRERQERGEQ